MKRIPRNSGHGRRLHRGFQPVHALFVQIFRNLLSSAAPGPRLSLRLSWPATPLCPLSLGLCLCLLTCCASTNGIGELNPAPGWERVRQAAARAATSPATWVPAVGALALQIDNADHKLSDWAVRTTPVYGSQRRADRTSDILLDASGAIWLVSGVVAPGGYPLAEWAMNKAKDISIELAAGVITRGVVGDMKAGSERTRPNGANQSSFPSGHASGSSFYMTVASRHVAASGWSPRVTTAAQFGLGTIAAATAWARVEAQHHYPADVLAGLAVGHFFGTFLTDAFLGPANPRNAAFLLEPSRDGALAFIRLNF